MFGKLYNDAIIGYYSLTTKILYSRRLVYNVKKHRSRIRPQGQLLYNQFTYTIGNSLQSLNFTLCIGTLYISEHYKTST